MASRLGDTDDDVIADINITPFVDIILVVLIIFMVTTSAIERSAIQVNLPEAASGEGADSISLGLTLLPDGGLLLDGAPVTPEGLRRRLREAQTESSQVVCLISADKAVAHGRVVWLLDLVKSEGIARFAINIDKTQMVPSDPATRGEGRGVLPEEG